VPKKKPSAEIERPNSGLTGNWDGHGEGGGGSKLQEGGKSNSVTPLLKGSVLVAPSECVGERKTGKECLTKVQRTVLYCGSVKEERGKFRSKRRPKGQGGGALS